MWAQPAAASLLQHLFVDGFDTGVQGEGHPDFSGVDLAEGTHPLVVNRKGVIEEDDVVEAAVVSNLSKFFEDILNAASTPVASVDLVVHSGGAVGAGERTATLRGHVDHTVLFVEHVSGHEGQFINRVVGRAKLGAVTIFDPNIVDLPVCDVALHAKCIESQ